MELRERHFAELSQLTVRFFTTTPLVSFPEAEALVISVEGACSDSDQKRDAMFIWIMAQAAVQAWPASKALIFDLRNMSCKWDRSMSDALGRPFSRLIPTAIVCSALDRQELSNVIETDWRADPDDWLCSSLEAALECVEDKIAMPIRGKTSAQRDWYMATMLVRDLDISVRAFVCLESEGLATLRLLCKRTTAELLRIPNMNQSTVKEIKDALASYNLSLAED